MSRNGKNPKLDLRLNLSAHRGGPSGVARNGAGVGNGANASNNNSPRRRSSSSSSPTSPPSSCVSSETEQGGRCSSSSSPEPTSMVLVGCPRCLMYVMLSEDDPKCPKCKSTVLLDFLNDPKNTTATAAAAKSRKK